MSGRRVAACNAAFDHRRQLCAARFDDPLAVDAGELGLRGDLRDECLHPRAVGADREGLDHGVDEANELLSRVADVDRVVEAREDVDHHGVQRELPLVAPATVDRRFRDTGARGNRLHRQRSQQLSLTTPERIPLFVELSRTDGHGHVLRLFAINRAILELDHRIEALSGEPLQVGALAGRTGPFTTS